MDCKNLMPFLKWPGGKRQFIAKYINLIPKEYNHYYEPFLGGGSVFFSLLPNKATIADANSDLINLYIVMRDNPYLLKDVLRRHHEEHSREYYYNMRASNPLDSIERAGRFLYLNRTCYNGMYRVNQKGEFNVPIGTKTNCIYDIGSFDEYSSALRNVEILVSDFSKIIQKAQTLDLIFADPPYTVAHNQNGFIKYNENLFTWEDQKRLLDDLKAAQTRGSYIILTNANYKEIYEMYSDNGFHILVMERYSTLAGLAKKRGITEELLITSFPIEK